MVEEEMKMQTECRAQCTPLHGTLDGVAHVPQFPQTATTLPMDNVNQVLYGPTEDKLKLGGTAWLCLSLIANFGRADLGGFVGLLAVLAVVNSSDYLLRLVCVWLHMMNWTRL